MDAGSKTSDKGRAAAERLVNEMVQDFGEVGEKDLTGCQIVLGFGYVWI